MANSNTDIFENEQETTLHIFNLQENHIKTKLIYEHLEKKF